MNGSVAGYGTPYSKPIVVLALDPDSRSYSRKKAGARPWEADLGTGPRGLVFWHALRA
jgi:hypothetical protein